MNFEELTNIWNSNNRELEQTIRVNKELVKTIGISEVKSKLSSIKWTSIFEIVVGVFFLDFLIGFLLKNIADPRFAIPAMILLAVTIFSFVVDIRQLVMLLTIDSKASVVSVQKKLASLKRLEILDIYSLLIIIPLFSSPFLIVVAKAFAGLSLYDFGTRWMIWYASGSVVVAAIITFFLRMYPNRQLREATDFLNELREVEE